MERSPPLHRSFGSWSGRPFGADTDSSRDGVLMGFMGYHGFQLGMHSLASEVSAWDLQGLN